MRSHLVEHVDGLVGEEAVRDVAVREFHDQLEHLVRIRHLMMVLVAVLDVLQDLQRLLRRGRFDDHLLESTLQGTVLLDRLAIFVERRGTDTLHHAPRQGWLEDIGSIHRARRRSRTDDGVDLVDEDDHLRVALYLLEDRADTLLKLTPVFRSRHDTRHVERHDPLVEKRGRRAVLDDHLRQSFYDGTLAHTGFADEHRIVLLAASQDLADADDLALAAHHRVEFPLLGCCREIRTEVVEGRRRTLGLLGARLLRSTALAARLLAILLLVVVEEHIVVVIVGQVEPSLHVVGQLAQQRVGLNVVEVVSLERHLRARVCLVVENGKDQVLHIDDLAMLDARLQYCEMQHVGSTVRDVDLLVDPLALLLVRRGILLQLLLDRGHVEAERRDDPLYLRIREPENSQQQMLRSHRGTGQSVGFLAAEGEDLREFFRELTYHLDFRDFLLEYNFFTCSIQLVQLQKV